MTPGAPHDQQHSCVPPDDPGSNAAAHATLYRDVTVTLENGLHLVPCSRIAEHVRGFEGAVFIRLDDKSVNAKSIFDLLTLRAPFGTILTLEASGPGAAHLVEGLAALFERNFESE